MKFLFIYDALNYSLLLTVEKRIQLKKELDITLNSNKVKLLKNGDPVMVLSGSNNTKRPLFVSSLELDEEAIEELFLKYQLDKFYEVNEEEEVGA
ncbi:hypothetical protein EI427_05725 [Flammeovirga pectinis]|uniref:Uncharacterized protein n=1 Tax=Flammeovirga pectinis TaxID=2494373 RepID=A0A3S9P0S6_9BACT|nr:hypothetical protein [Flammeovirga pectinis]AZQ61750.1 hypothetical protein EI427_05725 [Flammeovirga pectinis]